MKKARREVVLVTGLSGGGKASVLRALEDLGYEAVDNPPLSLIGSLVAQTGRPLAIGVDCRTHGFDAGAVLGTLERLRGDPALRAELVYAWAETDVLQRRFAETRRRHPLAPYGLVTDGVAAEQTLTQALREEAGLVIDTSDLPLSELRLLIERHFGAQDCVEGGAGLLISLISFAYPAGLPRQADLVFDARFLRNPHYDAQLKPLTGMDARVGAFIETDQDFPAVYGKIAELLMLLLPRFVRESKKYLSVAIGCTGGRHRSVYIVETLARDLQSSGWRVHITHRELARRRGDPDPGVLRSAPRTSGADGPAGVEERHPGGPLQAQEA